jgi:hypothetical protein
MKYFVAVERDSLRFLYIPSHPVLFRARRGLRPDEVLLFIA